LRRCIDGEWEEPLDPENTEHAVILMKLRLQLVIDMCKTKGCWPEDEYIAAALAQNGPAFSHIYMKTIPNYKTDQKREERGTKKNWEWWWEGQQPKNTSTQLRRFKLVTDELAARGWFIPPFRDAFKTKSLTDLTQ
jgi:hypothetical protein